MSAETSLALATFGACCVAAGMVPGVLLGKHVAQDTSRRALDRVAAMIEGVLDRIPDEAKLPASERSYGAARFRNGGYVHPAPGSDADLRDLEPYDQERPATRTWGRDARP